MSDQAHSGNELCYLDGRQSVFQSDPEMTESPFAAAESALVVWGRTVFAAVVVVVLIALGIANVAMYSRWHEVEDGVFWDQRAEGVSAVEVLPGSAADAAGIHRGDVLLAVNGSPIESAADVVEHQHRSHEGTRMTYTLLRLGAQQTMSVSLAPTPRSSSRYYVLAAFGLFTLLVVGSVRLRRPRDQATLHFFWICVAFFGVFTFSFTGPLDRLDWIFYWGDAVAFALLPPLLLHFTLVFPERPREPGRTLIDWIVPAAYVPGFAIAITRIVTVARASTDGAAFSRTLDTLDRLEHAYLFVCAAAAVLVLARTFRTITSTTARRQLRWIAWGTT